MNSFGLVGFVSSSLLSFADAKVLDSTRIKIIRVKDLKLLDLKLFIETPLETCLQRRLSRDLRERGRTKDEITYQFRQTVIPMYKKYIHPTRARANFFLNGVNSVDENITLTVDHLMHLISG